MRDSEDLRYFLGLEVARSKRGIFISQRSYTLRLLQDLRKLTVRRSSVPIAPNHKLAHGGDTSQVDASSYRQLVGRLIYLGATRPDIANAVHILVQFMDNHSLQHWQAACYELRYLKATPRKGILFSSNSD